MRRGRHLPIAFKFSLLITAVLLVWTLVPMCRSAGRSPQDNRQLQRDSSQTNRASERRIALVIGNGAYTNVPPLKNPPNDATLVATTLKKLGFEVSVGMNKSQREMKQLIRSFGQRLRAGGGVGLFYFAGHGVQSKGHNYLIPVDADIQNEADVEDVGVDVNYVLNMIEDAQSALNIVILDACRNNPFARSFRSAQGGLAQVKAPTGTLIAYATAPDSTAADGDRANSPYTEELTKQMETPGVVLETMFRRVTEQVSSRTGGRQEPWVSDNHKGEFYFSSGPTNASSTTTAKIDAVAVDPQQYYARSLAHFNRGELDRALVDINKAIKLSPAFAQAYAIRAGIYHLKNNLDNAITDSSKAIDLNLNHEAPYLVRGGSYNVKGSYDQALADFNKAIQINPQSAPAYSGRGVSYSGKGDYDKAIADYTRGITLDPNEMQAYYNRGAAYFQKKNYDLALADFSKTIQLNPKLAVAYNYRALVYEKKGDMTRAEADRKKYRELYGIN